MRTLPLHVASTVLLWLLVGLLACTQQGDAARSPKRPRVPSAPSAQDPSQPDPWVPRPIRARLSSTRAPAVDSRRGEVDTDVVGPGPGFPGVRGDSAKGTDGSSAGDSAVPKPAARDTKRWRPLPLSPADSARWPVQTAPPLPGSLLPEHRIVAYYGNPNSTRMGILGQIPPEKMLPQLERVATGWAEADTARAVMPALHLIAVVAQGKPGRAGKYRLRMSDSLIERVASWAEERGWVLILDIQTGHSTVAAELPHLVPFLQRPYVHLALDPEFAMTKGGVPGRRIGTLDASDVNLAIRTLAGLVSEHKLPPKVLVVHRFTRPMLTNTHLIALDPRVQVVIDMDGFGTPRHKEAAYRSYIVPFPVQYTGFKLFYKNDRSTRARRSDFVPSCPDSVYKAVGCGDDGLMTPEQVLQLYPVPLYIQYQ